MNGETSWQKWRCAYCNHIYDEAAGDAEDGIAPGTRLSDLPDDWCCPQCGAADYDFILIEG